MNNLNTPDLHAPLEDLPDVGQVLRGEVPVILSCWLDAESGMPRVVMHSDAPDHDQGMVNMATCLSFILDQIRREYGAAEVEAVLRATIGSHVMDGHATARTTKALAAFGVTAEDHRVVRSILDRLFGA